MTSRHAAHSRTDTQSRRLLHSQVVHHIPGRLRVRFPSGMPPDFYASLEQALETIPGVDSVRVNAAAGSAVIHYDPEHQVHWDELQRASELQGVLGDNEYAEFAEAAETFASRALVHLEGHSHLAEAIVRSAESLDERLRIATDGYLDLKLLLPVAAAALSTLHKARNKGTPMWMSMWTFAFNAFMSLHRNRVDHRRVQPIDYRTLH